MSQAEAIDRLEAHAREVINLLPSQARQVKPTGKASPDVDHTCAVGLEQKTTGQVRVGIEYEVSRLDARSYPEYVASFTRYAKTKGWSGPQPSDSTVVRFRPDPALAIDVRTSDDRFFVTGHSECIWPDGHR